MTRDWIFVPVIVQVLMTLLIYVRLIKVKVREMKAGKVDMARRGLHEDAWPENPFSRSTTTSATSSSCRCCST